MLSTYNSMIFGNLMQPLAHAVSQLVSKDRQSTNWKTNEVDSDWIFTGILLAVFMLETSWRWTKLHKFAGITAYEGREDLKFYRELRNAHGTLPEVDELFVLRNALVHGHLWQVAEAASEGAPPAALPLALQENALWKLCVDVSTLRTKALNLHVVPSLMDRRDLKVVLQRTVEAWTEMVRLDLLLPQTLSRTVVWPSSGERITIGDLAGMIGP